jgi:hypothetical protein
MHGVHILLSHPVAFAALCFSTAFATPIFLDRVLNAAGTLAEKFMRRDR